MKCEMKADNVKFVVLFAILLLTMGNCLHKPGASASSALHGLGKERALPVHGDSVAALAAERDNRFLFSGDASGALGWWQVEHSGNVQAWQQQPQRLHDAAVTQMAACEGWLASASRDRSVRLWHTREQEFVAAHTLPAAAAVVSGVDFIAGRKDYLSSGSRDGTVCFWDTSRPSAPLNSTSLAQNTVTSIRHVPQSNCVLQASEDKTLRVWIREGNVLHQFPRQSNILYCCASSPDGNCYATGSAGTNGSGCLLMIWDARQQKKLSDSAGHQETITDVVAWNCGSLEGWATSSRDGRILFWDRDGNSIPSASVKYRQPLASLCWMGEGVLAAGTADGCIMTMQLKQNAAGDLELIR